MDFKIHSLIINLSQKNTRSKLNSNVSVSTATGPNAETNHMEVFDITQATLLRKSFVDLMSSKNVGIMKKGKSTKMAVIRHFSAAWNFKLHLSDQKITGI